MTKKISVLYIDDNPMDRALIRDSLEKEHGGFVLKEAKSQEEFEKQISEREFDLVLTDFNILGYEGLQVLETVKEKRPDTPVIIVTGTGSEQVAVESMKRGAADYVIKSPQHVKRLPQTILSVLKTRSIQLERDVAQEALDESEERFRRLFENLGDAVFVTKVGGTDQGEIMEVNPAAEKQTGYTKAELIGMNIIKHLSIEKSGQISTDEWEKKLRNGEMITIVEKKRKKDGFEYWTEVTVTLIEFKGVKASLSINHDITNRKKAEEQIKKSLKEKEILIKEIQHRVKNNLAVVSGLLHIQSRYIKNKEAIAAFKDTQDRIASMAAVHSSLSNSEDYSTLDYAQYIKNLVSNLFYSSHATGQVKLHFDLDEITLPIDKAIPCGLLLNELVTNSLKHAFPENRKGKLSIIMRSLQDKNCEIIVKDDGIGMPNNFDIKNSKSLGLKLINSMIQQIDGTIKIISKKGTEFRIRLSTEPGHVIR